MSRKRTRSAWNALSPTRNIAYAREHTRIAATDSATHVSLVQKSSATLDEVPSTPLIVPAHQIRRMQKALGLTPEPATHELVFLHPSTERTARSMLAASTNIPSDLTNLRPATDPDVSESFKQHRISKHPPRSQRRLSAASAVTPIACSEPPTTSSPAGLQEPPPLPQPESLTRPPSPITPHHPPTARALFATLISPQLPNPCSAIKQQPPPPLFTTGSGNPLPPITTTAIGNPLPPINTTANPIPPASLFSTASGKALALPTTPAVSLFTTASGKALQIPAADAKPGQIPFSLFSTGAGKAIKLPEKKLASSSTPPPFAPERPQLPVSLFTTASGKPVAIPPKPNANSRIRQPSNTTTAPFATPRPAHASNSGLVKTSAERHLAPFATPPSLPPRQQRLSTFASTTSRQQPSVILRSNFTPTASSSLCISAAQSNNTLFGPPPSSSTFSRRSRSTSIPSPHTPSLPIGNLRKALFPESAHSSAVKKPAMPAGTPTSKPPQIRRRITRSSAKSTTRTTPFKRPRQLNRPMQQTLSKGTTTNKCNVPHFPLPNLLKDGRLTCVNAKNHECLYSSDSYVAKPPVAPIHSSVFQSPSFLQECHGYVFVKEDFGHFSCLPPFVSTAINFPHLTNCGVDHFVQWMKTMFSSMEKKPVSCVGSEAWARMAYSLAVSKLALLHLSSTRRASSFFCAANVAREFLRRITIEWHQSKQSHLLRMMRKDSSPASHAVLRIVAVEQVHSDPDTLTLLVSDGWYVARCDLDETVMCAVWKGRLRVTDKICISGSVLHPASSAKPFFFGDADELGSSHLHILRNGVRKALNRVQLGIRKTYTSRSLKRFLDNGGACPPVEVVILRSYPVFYMESVSANEEDKPEIICRREEGEDEARTAFEYELRRKTTAAMDQKKVQDESMVSLDAQGQATRVVRCVKDLLVCGLDDNPNDPKSRKSLRIYNVPDALQSLLVKEGEAVTLRQVWPRTNSWLCKSEGIQELRHESKTALSIASQFPRRVCSVAELYRENLRSGEEFDGVYSVLHVPSNGNDESNRFVYMIDDPGTDIRVLALELSDQDAICLPRALRSRGGLRPRFPLIGVQDAQFRAVSAKHNLVHGKASLKTSIFSVRTLKRQRKRANLLRTRCEEVESRLEGKEEQLEILREAVISFAAGNINNIGAYFTYTQDM